ncbi:MAG: cation diffusion facilitator family transporter [Bacteroidota bacterium]|nr:cation diffusion facilitator family transporter [Bacteroidota bacterium]
MDNHREKYLSGVREGWISGLANVILFGIKLWAGIVSGSIALIADAWHTLSDTISSILIIIGLKWASKPPDKEHPFGHGRIEILVSIVIGILLILVGVHFISGSLEKLKNTESANFGIIAIVVTVVSLLTKEALAQYALRVGRITGIESIKADGWHHRSDAFSSGIILIGIAVQKYVWWIDGLLGIFVALIIFYSAYVIIIKAITTLLGQDPRPEQVVEIKEIAGKIHSGNLRLHHFHIHNYGFHNEMTFHIVLPPEMRLREANRITQTLFKEIKEKMNILATIHIDTKSKY